MRLVAPFVMLLGGCTLSPQSVIEDAEPLSDTAGAVALDYVCNRMRVRVLRDQIATSAHRLKGWSMLCDTSPVAPALGPVAPALVGGPR